MGILSWLAGRNDAAEAEHADRLNLEQLEDALMQSTTDLSAVRVTTDQLRDALYESSVSDEECARRRSSALVIFASSAIHDDTLDVPEAEVLMHMVRELGIDEETIEATGIRDLWNRIRVAAINGMGVTPVVTDLFLKRGETAVYESVAELMGNPPRRYKGRSNGFSFTIAKGVRFHTSWLDGSSVVDPVLVVKDVGPLTLTTHRLVFRGAARTIETRLDKIAGLNLYADGVSFNASNRERVDLFRLPDAPVLAAALAWMSDRQVELERGDEPELAAATADSGEMDPADSSDGAA